MVIYEGIFFENEELQKIIDAEKVHLSDQIKDIHCTFKFKPEKDQIFYELVGKEFEIALVGYGVSDTNSGFLVDLDEELKKHYLNYDSNGKLIEPHITVSLSSDGVAKNTKFLKFESLKTPITVKGKFGFWISSKNYKGVTFNYRNNRY